YRTLADVPEQTVIRLHEAPLEIVTQLGLAKLLPALQQGMTNLKVPQPYFDLLKQIQSNPSELKTLTTATFGEWSARKVRGIDTQSPIFKTLLVTLAECGLLTTAEL